MKTTIEKLNEDNYLLNKNKDFKILFYFINDFYKNKKFEKKEDKENIKNLLKTISLKEHVCLLSKIEIELLFELIDSSSMVILEKENKNEKMNEYLKIASDFNKTLNSILR